jgi:hypothetical protein
MNVKEASELIELGFEYVTGEYNDGGKIFRRRSLSYLLVVYLGGVVV